jgi:hypothetical protein
VLSLLKVTNPLPAILWVLYIDVLLRGTLYQMISCTLKSHSLAQLVFRRCQESVSQGSLCKCILLCLFTHEGAVFMLELGTGPEPMPGPRRRALAAKP